MADLAGVDVHTIPLKVAEAAKKELDGKWRSRLSEKYSVSLAAGVDPKDVRLETLWDIAPAERKFLEKLNAKAPSTGEELVQMANDAGVKDFFPGLSESDRAHIAKDGKIPKHETWRSRVRSGELAIDTLLNLAGLASFTADQKELDDRIRRFIR